MRGRLVVLLALVVVWQLAEGRRNAEARHRPGRGRPHPRRGTDAAAHRADVSNLLAPSDATADCHKAAVHWCGRSFTKVSKLLDFLSGDQAFQAKCALRKAFFTCLDKIKEKPCKKYHKYHKDDNFRKKLADKLWATRVCVLGVKDAK